MAIKRKRSEATLVEGDAPQRQLRSGQTQRALASPKTSKGAAPPTPVRSSRKRPKPSASVANEEDTNYDAKFSNNSSPSKRRRPTAAKEDVASPKKRGRPPKHQIPVVDDNVPVPIITGDEGIVGAMETPRKPKRKGKITSTDVDFNSHVGAMDNAPDATMDSGDEAFSTSPTSSGRTRKRTVEVVIPSPSKRAKHAKSAVEDVDPSGSYPTPEPSLDFHEPSTAAIGHQRSGLHATLLPANLATCINLQKREILKSLRCPAMSSDDDLEPSVNEAALKQLNALVEGTVMRAEGNSCLLVGPRGSGKSQVVESCLEALSVKPIILRLSGWVQSTDKHALREIAFQLLQQTGSSILEDADDAPIEPTHEDDEDENPFLDKPNEQPLHGEQSMRLPPSSQLHALIPVLLTLSRPVIVILDGFDLFALHPRQSLLYCLLDSVQSCRASSENRGLAVIGVTSRIDTIQLLEKRVKSRFSGRTIRTAPPNSLQSWIAAVKSVLKVPISCESEQVAAEWNQQWSSSVDTFVSNPEVRNAFNETFSIIRDVKILQRILINPVLRLSPSEPHLSFKSISAAIESQRARPRNIHFTNLSYPSLCLLIATMHVETAGHPAFTFEMLFDRFRDQLRASTSAPVQVNGGNIGMVRCTREVLMTAFDSLIATRVFVCTAATSTNVAKEFIKHRSVLDREIVKKVVDKSGQIHLKKWLHKGN